MGCTTSRILDEDLKKKFFLQTHTKKEALRKKQKKAKERESEQGIPFNIDGQLMRDFERVAAEWRDWKNSYEVFLRDNFARDS